MTFDVAIVGGGLSGLLFARHVTRDLPGLRIAIIDGAQLPRSREALRLGESTSEAGAWYLDERLGLSEHLRRDHLMKNGLRFFFSDVLGEGLASRSELGLMTSWAGRWELPFEGTRPPTFQLHRGRLEHFLARELADVGVRFFDQAEVLGLQLGSPHRLQIRRAGVEETVDAAWVVDASGGPTALGLPGPPQPTGHRFRASWFWVKQRLDPSDWTDDASFQARIPPDFRWRSTVHLMGHGYWVWLIGLTSGHTSVGIVADPELPDPEADPMAWLADREPELAEALAGTAPIGAHSRVVEATRVPWMISEERVARVGDAAGFLDPLYSGAIDMMALTNELVVGCLAEERSGGKISRRCRYANMTHSRIVDQFEWTVRDLYGPLLGNARVMSAKVVWDHFVYFNTIALWLRSGQLGEPLSLAYIGDSAARSARLQERVQQLLRVWGERESGLDARGHVDVGQTPYLVRSLNALRTTPQDHALSRAAREGVERLEKWVICVFERACEGLGLTVPEGPLNPYAVGLDPSRWHDDGLTAGRARIDPGTAFREEAAAAWLDGP